MIFGENLRLLCASEASVSEVCRAIGVNRTQFSRYLSGEAFPRPDLLYRICHHFGVDANILIRPLNAAAPTKASDVLSETFARIARLVPGDRYGVSEHLLPTGIYRQWRRSFMWPTHVFSSLCRIWRDGAVTHWKAYEPGSPNYMRIGNKPGATRRRQGGPVYVMRHHGCVIAVNHTACIIGAEPDNLMLRLTTLSPDMSGGPGQYVGYTALTRGLVDGAVSVVSCFHERVEPNTHSLLSAAREPLFHRIEDLPPRLQSILTHSVIIR